MSIENLISSYFKAWNTASTKNILQHLTADCVQYDDYWHTTVPCEFLTQYLKDDFRHCTAQYALVGDANCSHNRIIYKYRATLINLKHFGVAKFVGAEVLALRRGKIKRITHMYTFPAEVAALYDIVGKPTTPAVTGNSKIDRMPEDIEGQDPVCVSLLEPHILYDK